MDIISQIEYNDNRVIKSNIQKGRFQGSEMIGMAEDRELHISGEDNSVPAKKYTEKEQLGLLWQPAGDGARLLKVYGNTGTICLPDMVETRRITEIGVYCFAEREPEFHGCAYLRELPDPDSAIRGNYVEEIRLPYYVEVIENAAFYNCRKLKYLHCGPHIRSIGGNVFTNDRIDTIFMHAEKESRCGLGLLMARITEDITVRFWNSEEEVTCSLFFPEYYELLDEIAPAHIFGRFVEGEGYRMRNCFRDGILDFEEYDRCYPYVMREESAENLMRIALNRLQWPVRLTNEHRVMYEKAVKDHLETALQYGEKKRDISLLHFLCQQFAPGDILLAQALDRVLAQDWGEGAAFYIEERQKQKKPKSYDFDLDF